MPTRVVNLRKELYDVYIGRPGKGEDGYFGNPCIPGKTCPVCESIHVSPRETIPCFEVYARKRLLADAEYRERVGRLRGKRLGCFCKPAPCHGDVLHRLAEELPG